MKSTSSRSICFNFFGFLDFFSDSSSCSDNNSLEDETFDVYVFWEFGDGSFDTFCELAGFFFLDGDLSLGLLGLFLCLGLAIFGVTLAGVAVWSINGGDGRTASYCYGDLALGSGIDLESTTLTF